MDIDIDLSNYMQYWVEIGADTYIFVPTLHLTHTYINKFNSFKVRGVYELGVGLCHFFNQIKYLN